MYNSVNNINISYLCNYLNMYCQNLSVACQTAAYKNACSMHLTYLLIESVHVVRKKYIHVVSKIWEM